MRPRLSGEDRLVEESVAQEHAVGGHGLARQDADAVSRRKVHGGGLRFPAVGVQAAGRGGCTTARGSSAAAARSARGSRRRARAGRRRRASRSRRSTRGPSAAAVATAPPSHAPREAERNGRVHSHAASPEIAPARPRSSPVPGRPGRCGRHEAVQRAKTSQSGSRPEASFPPMRYEAKARFITIMPTAPARQQARRVAAAGFGFDPLRCLASMAGRGSPGAEPRRGSPRARGANPPTARGRVWPA